MNKKELYKTCLSHMDDVIWGYKYGNLFFLNPFFKIEEFVSAKKAICKDIYAESSKKEKLCLKKDRITKWFHPSYIYDYLYYRHRLKRDIDEYYIQLHYAAKIMKEHIEANHLKGDDAKLYIIDYLTNKFDYYHPHF